MYSGLGLVTAFIVAVIFESLALTFESIFFGAGAPNLLVFLLALAMELPIPSLILGSSGFATTFAMCSNMESEPLELISASNTLVVFKAFSNVLLSLSLINGCLRSILSLSFIYLFIFSSSLNSFCTSVPAVLALPVLDTSDLKSYNQLYN
jgi:hypothetical protein